MKQFAQWGFLFICLIIFNKISGQINCDFDIETSMEKASDCDQNGVIKVILKGDNVDNKIIDTTDALYSITSTITGQATPFDANKGIIQGVAPGTYIVTVNVFCTNANGRVIKQSSTTVTIPGTYPGFDQNEMKINTAEIKKSLECSSTGTIPVHVGGGRAPYSIKIVEAPDANLIDSVITSSSAGVVNIDNVPWGKYKLALSDACGYTVYREPSVDKIEPEYSVTGTENTPMCLPIGKIHLSLKNGTLPYTIVLTSFPDEYTGEDTLTVEQDSNYTIDSLPAGTYEFKVSDKCHPQSFSRTISETKPAATIGRLNSSAPCKEEGEIEFRLSGGLAPYTIKSISYPDNTDSPFHPYDSAQVSTAKDTTIKNLYPGKYTFLILDQCRKDSILYEIEIDTLKLKLSIDNIVAASSCYINDGKATVTIQGGAPPYTASMVNETTNSTIAIPAGPPYNFTNLAPGNYKFKIIDDCEKEDSASFTLIKDTLRAKLGNIMTSAECGASGEINVSILDGIPEYTLIISQNGVNRDTLGPSNETDYKFESLPSGKYDIKVMDKCNDSVEFKDVEIKSFDFGDPPDGPGTIKNADLYENDFLPLANKDCYQVIVKRRKATNTDFYKLWTNEPELFEVAFVPNNNPDYLWTWINVQDTDTLSFDARHCVAMQKDSSYTVYIRMKVEDPDWAYCSDTIMDIIKFPDVKASISKSATGCDTQTWRIQHDNFMCFPYKITVKDTINKTSETNEYAEISSYQDIVLPHGVYIIEIADDNCIWLIDTISSETPSPPSYSYLYINYKNHTCSDYSMDFSFYSYYCYNYEWILREKDNPDEVLGGGKISSLTDYNDPQKRTQTGMEYDKEYEVCLLFDNQQEYVKCTRVYQQKRPDPVKYQLDFATNYCLPDTAKGYIRLYRTIDFEKGAVISFVDGPTTPIHTEYIVPQQNGIRNFYPFSANPLSDGIVDIEEGLYKFEILDSCGRRDTISVDYLKSTVKDFGYERSLGCTSTDIQPKGSIYLGNAKIRSYFRIIKTPDGVAPINTIITEGGSFSISESGRYLMQISQGSGTNSCPFDSISFVFIKENVSLDADSTLTYVCDENSDGYIKVKRKGGVGPFTYELFDNNVSIEKNNTGIFYYGRYGESYIVKITDEGCGIEFPQRVYMLDLSKTRIINDDIKLCLGDDIKLMSLSVGSYSGYNWTGPNGWTSKQQNPVIPNATVDMNGIYSITVRPEGCMKDIVQHVNIDVINPDPLPDTTIYYCLNDIAVPLTATPEEGNQPKWYDTDTVHVVSAPVPPTDKVDTLDYFVSQVNSIYGCESEKSIVRVIIEDFPETVAYAYADDICRNDVPVIVIPDTYIYPDYVYRVYNSSGEPIGRDTAQSDTLRIQSSESLESSGALYIEVETNHRCVSTDRSKVPVKVIHPAPPVVYDTLYCLDETDVLPVRADSTAENRLQWYDTDTVTILPSAPIPPTNVAGEFSYWVAQVDTLLGCIGDKAELKVSISDLPASIDINASASEICRRTSPVAIVENTFNLYTYTLFDRNSNTLDSKISDGTPVNLNSSDYILHQNDTLYVEVQNQHKCTSRDRAVVPVSVVIPDVPQVFDTLYCLNAAAIPIRAIPDEGYYIQWYALEGNPVASAPVPPTNSVNTLYYYVTQKHNVLHCESDTLETQVIIETLPETILASSPPICPGQHPVIEIPATTSELSYNVYSESGTLIATRYGSGDSIRIVLPYPIHESENYYVEAMNLNNCVSADKTKRRTEVVNYMYLLPDKIPQYQRGKLYRFQLESNAVSPYEFSTYNMLPSGFNLSVDGLITGTPPQNGMIEPVPFHVKVVDVNGCFAEKDYVLESDIFIPQAFTPNGDGKNDVFMKGRRLVIFDRLGLKVFEGDDGWDGRRSDGTIAPPDTYFYLIYYEDENLMTQGRKKGYITLIRR
jgi:gliding motility-associated-like protein